MARAQAKDKPPLGQAKRVVIKIGSALLIDAQARPRARWLKALALDIAELRRQGRDVILVSSGAVALGREPLGLGLRPLKLEQKQAAAAIGQIRLAHAYQQALGRQNIAVAQILLTIDDTEERRRHLNARGTLNALLRQGIVPIINENDTVATEEIRYGDNDRLAARVAVMIGADCLVLLSDIDGLYTADPRTDPSARHLARIDRMTPAIFAMAGKARPGYSSGGMVTKLLAAQIATEAGCRMAIADGTQPHAIRHLLEGGRASWFEPATTPRAARKNWIAGSLKPAGKMIVDAGACRALAAGRSLLPAGVRRIEGQFRRGDAVLIANEAGEEIARGISAYSAQDARRIVGCNSRMIESLLGYRGRDEIIHRDDLVVTS